jgi:ABC-type glycerol-3-phosphate transport system substrate-binding protein
MYHWQGKQYGLPWLAFRVLFYNVDLLQQQGLARPPTDWKDKRWHRQVFLDTLRRFVQPGTPPQPGGTWAFGTPLAFLDAWVWVLGSGGDLFSADERKFTLDQSAALDGLQFYADLMARHHVHPTPSQAAQDATQGAFLAGRMVFYYGPALVAARLKQVPFRSDAAPVPWGQVSTNTTGGGHSWPMNKASKEQEAAWQLQKFLGSKENDLIQVEAGEAPPFRRSTAALPAWRERRPPEHPEVMGEGAMYLRPQPKVPTWNEINRLLNSELRPVWEGQRSPREAVLALKQPIEQLLEQGWRTVAGR